MRPKENLAYALLRRLAEAGAETGWLDTPAGQLRWAARGRKGAPPLLVLHGMGDSLGGWAQAALPLLARFRVHLLDLPGHGLSDAPPDWRFSTFLDGVGRYLERLERPLVVGHSLGGWLAVRLLRERAAPAAGLVLVNPGGFLPPPEEWAAFGRLVQAADTRGVRAYLRSAWYSPPLTLRLLPGEVTKVMQADSTRGFLAGLGEPDFLRPEELSSLRLPLRLGWGERDRLLPRGTLDFFRRHLPAHDFVPLGRAGHNPHLETPLRLAHAIARSLDLRGHARRR